MMDLLICILAAFRLTHFLVFDPSAEGLREQVGIDYLKDERGNVKDRAGFNWLAEIVNCSKCVSLFCSAGIVLAWHKFAPWQWPLWLLALSGADVLLHRWYVSQRPRAEWWH